MINRVLIMDDLKPARIWLGNAVQTAFKGAVIDQAEDIATARTKLNQRQYDLFLSDLELPDGNGIDLIKEVRKSYSTMVIVVTTIHDEDAYLFPALRAGAQGYILKEHTVEEISSMLQQAVEGEPPVSPSVARKLIGFFQGVENSKQQVALTQREKDVLQIVAKGYTIAEAAKILEISHNTASGYLKLCYKKLQISSRAEATSEAIRLGII